MWLTKWCREACRKKEEVLEKETIKRRLESRRELVRKAFALTSIGKGVAEEENIFSDCEKEFRLLDATTGPSEEVGATVSSAEKNRTVRLSDTERAWPVHYRLAVSNVFVEKAQYHLEERAKSYRVWGVRLYVAALLLFAGGAGMAIFKFWTQPLREIHVATTQVADPAWREIHVATTQVADPAWSELLRVFLLAFTAYGFLVLTGVACARGAQACFDQRERLLAKRHSLRQGRLYLQLKGGNVTTEELDRAFNWNYDQLNAFTHLETDAQAPMGHVMQEIVKIIPDLVKTSVAASREAAKEKPKSQG